MILPANTYNVNFAFRNKHFNTLYRYFFSAKNTNYNRERLYTTDSDFMDLDLATIGSSKVIIAIHGLEGNSDSSYMHALAQTGNQRGYDVIAVNLRGCSGSPNWLLSSYHSGKTDDIIELLQYIDKTKKYSQIHLVGYSLGGNIVLKFMGEFSQTYAKRIHAAVGVSVPSDLKGAALRLNEVSNTLYQYNFLKTLRKKALQKVKTHEAKNLDVLRISNAKTFTEFDDCFTATTHGFKDAEDYWKKSSCKQFLKQIIQPCLLISALDDPFLSPSCYPIEEAKSHSYFHLLTPKHGGHVGFYSSFKTKNNNWLENQILDFFNLK